MGIARARIKLVEQFSWIDLLVLLTLVLAIYATVEVAREWAGPYHPATSISLGFFSLLRYSFFSLVRNFLAYLLSLVFTIFYGYWAAKSRRAEPILISILDILQSIPVLGFMPGLVLCLVHLFPRSNIGLELASIFMNFTGQGWNMVFSFYSSVKGVPDELRGVARVFRLSRWETLRAIEIPFAMNGLIWNSMLSMAGGWFFVMVLESFSLGVNDFRLPGIGSYMAVAYEQKNMAAVVAGITVMFLMIIVVDRCLWAPLVVWSQKFRYDESQLEGEIQKSVVLSLLKRSDLPRVLHRFQESFKERVGAVVRVPQKTQPKSRLRDPNWMVGAFRVVMGFGVLLAIAYGFKGMVSLLSGTGFPFWWGHIRDTFITFVRVALSVLLGSVWTIPVGVFIGTHPKWSARLQPVVQIIASFPAPMLFPLLTFLWLALGFSLNSGAVLLMIFSSQWYILFNVISGASRIPHQMIELCGVFRVSGWRRWRSVLLPGIFPSLVNGWISAAGGAWNASIVSEYVQYGTHTLTTRGIGASITLAAQSADYPRLAGGIVVMVTTVVLINRFFWDGLYKLAETRFKLEG